jgi:non-ribosomal peptide synthetase component F
VELPPDAVDPAAVERVARAYGTTAFAVLLAAFFTTLRRTGGVDEAVVGVPVACRNRPGTEGLIGYLVNTVALRVRFTEGMRFHELIARTDEVLAEALTNQELPFADAVDGLARHGGAGENPLFQAMFAWQSTPVDGFDDIEDLDITEQFVHSRTAKVALTWTMRQNAAGLAGEVEYAADRFDQTLGTSLAGRPADAGHRRIGGSRRAGRRVAAACRPTGCRARGGRRRRVRGTFVHESGMLNSRHGLGLGGSEYAGRRNLR